MSTTRKTTTAPVLSGSGVLILKPIDRLFGQAGSLTVVFYLTTVVMVASLVLGGGTRGGFLSDAILQLIAVPSLLFTLWKLFEVPLTQQIRMALLFCLAVAALPLVQLIPLPPWIWTALPNRQPSAAAFEIVGHKVPWMPISVSPEGTWLSALSLIPPMAIFIGTLLLSYRERRALSLVVIAVGIVSVFVGLIQVAQGPESPLRFFAFTNPAEAVGFFANRNHFAALTYALIMFAAVWSVHAAAAAGTLGQRGQFDVAKILAAIGGFTVLVIFLAGEAMARSRAGLGLAMVALFGALVLGFSKQSIRPGSASNGFWSRLSLNSLLANLTPTKLLIAAVAVTVTFSLQYALYRIQERFTADPSEDWRQIFVPNTIEAAWAYMPFGSGLGTFVSVYPLFEKPEDTLTNVYANHAHNDAAEAWLETGVFGLILMGIFLGWLVLRSVAVWRRPPPAGANELDWLLARAATIVISLLLAHSLVDYPLRTGGMMAILAFACALLIEPPTGVESQKGLELDVASTRQRERHEIAPASSAALGSSAPRPRLSRKAADIPRSQDQRWGADINWPKEWAKSDEPGAPGDKNEPPDSSKPPDK